VDLTEELTVARNIQARRKLSDLFARGVEVRFGSKDGEPYGKVGPFEEPPTPDEVAMWVTPPSPLQRDMSMRDAQAARARALLRTLKDQESEEHLTAMAFLADMDFPTLIDYTLMADTESRRNEAVRDVLEREEWKDFTSYQDAMRKLDEDKTPEDDPEYVALMDLDRKYGEQVSAREMELTSAARDVMQMLGRDRVERKALEMRKEILGSQAFLHEYELQMTYYSVRDIKDHNQLFFDSAREWAEQDDQIRDTVSTALRGFIQEASEAKNSPGAVSGSESSELPSKPEISEASIPATANA